MPHITLGVKRTVMRTPPKALSPVICTIGAAIHLGFLFKIFSLKSPAGLFFPLLVLAPWLILFAASLLAAGRSSAAYVTLAASAAYLVFGAWAFWDVIHVHPDPQGGLVFLVIPAAASVPALILLLIQWSTKSKAPPAISRHDA